MRLRRIFNWKILAVSLAIGFVGLPVLVPASASAGSAGQVDICSGGVNCNQFVNDYINPAIKALTALVGIVAVLGIIISGIQYSASADDPGTVTKAKERIFEIIIGLVGYAFLVAFLNYLVPGGIW